MGPGQSIKTCLSKYAKFSGRASRPEFWWFILFLALIQFLLSNLFGNLNTSNTNGYSIHFGVNFSLNTQSPWWENIYTTIFFVPLIAVLSRRIHDIGIDASKLIVVPFAGIAAVILTIKAIPAPQAIRISFGTSAVLMAVGFLFITLKKSQPGPDKYGPNPHEVTP